MGRDSDRSEPRNHDDCQPAAGIPMGLSTQLNIGTIRFTRSISACSHPPPAYRQATRRGMAKPDLVVILGTTGTGKSKLAIELASALSTTRTSEIINGDSMQVYKGLDILTNKITSNETNGIPHHLMSFLDLDQDYTVERFRDDASKKVRSQKSIAKVPYQSLSGGLVITSKI
ncbi:hypothetical protein PGT21_009061 [Puccinia graminis f. sp. tritici]|uniref:tRNA dimethylallyltransferase n=1 Tax=Puccinia graminis f. sp. tritici TaxID=56615 RepID=A0A5B0QMG2_PUCGR|nr:hypothetical protein PGT21_009061 [Puccinia graminis f. sp. tritici]